MRNGIDKQTAFAQMLQLCVELQFYIKLIPIERHTSSVVQRIQKKVAHTLALTSRSRHQSKCTIEQLASHGIHFAISGFEPDIIDTSRCTYHYQDGIIFCQAYDKAKIFIEILQQLNYHPKRVIFIDDFLKNLQVLEQSLNEYDDTIEFIGIRYSHLDAIPFDPKIAEEELADIKKRMLFG